MSRNALAFCAAVALSLTAALVLHACGTRYQTVHVAGTFFATTDRWTGRVTVCRVSTLHGVECGLAPKVSAAASESDGPPSAPP